MSIFRMLLIGIVAMSPVMTRQAFAQKKKPASIAPAEPLKDGWEEIDKRLVFLMVRLANVEASLDAVEKAVGSGTRQRSARAGEAKRAEKGNETMDRKGGGPVKWSEFYGRTAEKFFYHPVDQNTTYHTTTILTQQSPGADNQSGEGVPSRQGLPVHQRPPQFDYIYKANRDAQARAEKEAGVLHNKVDALVARRRQLEDEQSALWCQIAFRVVSRYELPKKPLYRFEPVATNPDTESRNHAETVKAAAIFMRRALSIVEVAEQDQAKAFGSIKVVVNDACDKLDDAWLHQGILTDDAPDLKTPAGRFAALSKKLKDVSENLSDSYVVSIDGDRFKDEVRKDTFRGLLQESLVDYAQIVLALNEMSLLMASEWKSKPDLEKPLVFVGLEIPQRAVSPLEKSSLVNGIVDTPNFSGKSSPMPQATNSGASLFDTLDGIVRGRRASGGGIEFLPAAAGSTERSRASSRQSFHPPLIADFIVVAHGDAPFDVCPGIGGIRVNWGTNYNKQTIIWALGTSFEAKHVPITPEKENVVRISIDDQTRLAVAINSKQIFERRLGSMPGESKVFLGGGIGHVEYRQVKVTSAENGQR